MKCNFQSRIFVQLLLKPRCSDGSRLEQAPQELPKCKGK